MRWDALFDDLESQLASATSAQQESEIRERTRAEQSRQTLVHRLSGHRGGDVGLVTRGGRSLTGTLTTVGAAWIAVLAEGRSVLVPLSSLSSLRGLGRSVGPPLSGVGARLGLGSALRALSRDRAQVAVWLVTPSARYTGVIDRVGADFLDLGLFSSGDERSVRDRDVVTVPFPAVDTIDSAGSSG
ncbi:hypothetical protein E8P82_10030 [Arthrobacter echini]|uniref:Fis family transcriptional regulator n=1 Tax=Arthrobacter echini TaxID=1529066 RepID=A0A4S5E3L7_9MICC|nr:hypothetical protein [Arthrobacter echini]THJ65972.1 hypothetical protein E8P82_10030 [Arthrobacter echini]